MENSKLIAFIDKYWEQNVIPNLSKYISIPCVSAAFDSNWQKNGHLEEAAKFLVNWADQQNITGLKHEIIKQEGRSPLLFIEIPGTSSEADTVLFYGHFDKMPESEGWDNGLGAWQPAIRDGKLYGRGSSDNGHAFFGVLAACKALQEMKCSHPRCVMVIEGGEESGSPDLPTYLALIKSKIGNPKLIFCLDTDCNDHDRLWLTSSIRGLVIGDLHIEVLKTAVHSGAVGGIVPSPFLILQNLLNRIQNSDTGEILLSSAKVSISSAFQKQTSEAAKLLDSKVYDGLPFADKTQPLATKAEELLLNRDWRPALTITGAEGIPSLQHASNVIIPKISFKLSMRIPPTANAAEVSKELKTTLEKNPPYNANVVFENKTASNGWAATNIRPLLLQTVDEAANLYSHKNIGLTGIGGAVPVVILLSSEFPQAELINLGFGGSFSNCHGPNEFLPIGMAKALNCLVAHILSKLDKIQ